MLKIQELRARAEKELGDKFDQREFHDIVLRKGALPLEILEEQINEYIQRKKDLATNADPIDTDIILGAWKSAFATSTLVRTKQARVQFSGS